MHGKQNCPDKFTLLTELKNRNNLALQFRTIKLANSFATIQIHFVLNNFRCFINPFSIFYYISICLLSFNIRNSSTITTLTQKIRGHSLMNLRILKVLLIFAFKLFFHSLCTRPVIPKVCSADREISSSGPRIPIQINILCFTEH